MGQSFSVITYLLVLFRSSLSPAQSASVKACRRSMEVFLSECRLMFAKFDSPLLKVSARLFVPFK